MDNNICRGYREVTLVSGNHCYVKDSSLVGFCEFGAHPGFVTENLLDHKQCDEKNCIFFKKFAENDFWKRREYNKQKQIAAEEARIAEAENRKIKAERTAAKCEAMLDYAKRYVDAFDLDRIYVVRVAPSVTYDHHTYIINYVVRQSCRVDHSYFVGLCTAMGKRFHYRFHVRVVRDTEGKSVSAEQYFRLVNRDERSL